MSTINKLTNHWRRWINRSRAFESKEVDELENHLLEEIDSLVEKDGISEEEAFNKAVIEMGNRESLDQEFAKVRRFPLKKVKHWFAIHSWVMGAVIAGLIISTVNFSSKQELPPYINQEPIGDYEAINRPYCLDSSVTIKDKIYSFNPDCGNIFIFKINETDCRNEKNHMKPIWIKFIGTYFSDIPENFKIAAFDVDKQERFYFLLYNKQHSAEEIAIYHHGKLEKKISIIGLGENIAKCFIKVIDRIVVLGKLYTVYPQQYGIPNLTNEIIYFNLDEEKINLKSFTIPAKSDPVNYYLLDRAGKKIKILTKDGQILTYELQNAIFVLTDTINISNFSVILSPEDQGHPDTYSFSYAFNSMICSNDNKIIFRSNVYSMYYFISRFNDSLITVKHLTNDMDIGFLKFNYHSREYLAIIEFDTSRPLAWSNKIYSLK